MRRCRGLVTNFSGRRHSPVSGTADEMHIRSRSMRTWHVHIELIIGIWFIAAGAAGIGHCCWRFARFCPAGAHDDDDDDDVRFDTMNIFEFIIDSISSQITNGQLI